MVDALDKARELVKPGGVVLIVHDRPLSPIVELHQGPKDTVVGWLEDEEGFPLILQADGAAAIYIDSGQVSLDDQKDFTCRTLIDSLDGFVEWLEKQWDTSYLSSQLEEQIETSFLKDELETRVVVYRDARIRKLRVP